MLTDADLASMRTTLNASLPGTAVVQTSAWTSDGGGGGSTAWTASGTVSCRIVSMGGMEETRGGRISQDADFLFTLPAEAAITANDRIISAGGTFNVSALRAPRSYELSRRVEVERVV